MKKTLFVALLALTGCVKSQEERKPYYMELVIGPDEHEYILLNVNGYPQLVHAAGCIYDEKPRVRDRGKYPR